MDSVSLHAARQHLAQAVAALTPAEHGFTHLDLQREPAGTGRLDGWLLSAKDLSDVAGMPTGLGNPRRAYIATVTDPFLAELEAAGALIVGKSATPELGLLVDTPGVDNPLWPGCTPGGSSGGAAVQVARGILRTAHASDGGGSIRVPAAACGVVGFKPAGQDLAVAGFITRTVADAAFLHHLTPVRPFPCRVGVLVEPLFAETAVDPVMITAVTQAAAVLRAAGATVTAISPYQQASETFAAFKTLFTSRFATLPTATGYTAWVRDLGRGVNSTQLAQARRHATALPQLLREAWGVDAILTPMLSHDPPPAGTFTALPHQENFDAQTHWSPWGSLFNVARLPAVCVPWPVTGPVTGQATPRPPVGVQLGAITLSAPALLGLALALHP